VIAQPSVSGVTLYVWTDKTQYKPGEKGTLKMSVLNERDDSIEIRNITIRYPWFAYDAEKGWVGNVTIELDPAETLPSRSGDYSKEVEFTIPTDGRVAYPSGVGEVNIGMGTDKGPIGADVNLFVSSVSVPMVITGLDMWVTSLIVAIVVCTIILAIVILLATRGSRTPRFEALPPPPKSKAKAE
jgi:hypothetical protein